MKKNRLTMLFLGIVTLAVVIVYLAGGLGAASEGSHQSTLSGRVVINEYTMGVGTQVALQSAGISGVGYCVALDYVETEQ